VSCMQLTCSGDAFVNEVITATCYQSRSMSAAAMGYGPSHATSHHIAGQRVLLSNTHPRALATQLHSGGSTRPKSAVSAHGSIA